MRSSLKIKMTFFLFAVLMFLSGRVYAQTTISNCSELQNISNDPSGAYVLSGDINCANVAFTPISGFTGTLDGQGHTVSNLVINLPGQNQVGLFGSILEAGYVEDLIISNAQITGQAQVGALSGYMFVSSVSNVSVLNSQVSGTSQIGGLIGECYNGVGILNAEVDTVVVTGSDEVGGLVGRIWDGNLNNITQSSVKATVIGTGNSTGGIAGYSKSGDILQTYSEGTVQGNNNVGGIVGETFENAGIHNCYSVSSVSGSQNTGGISGFFNSYDDGISNTYFAGVVSGNGLTGAFFGTYAAGTVNSNYWDATLNPNVPGVGSGDIAEISARTSAEMFLQNTYVGWDFSTIWSINGSYPKLLKPSNLDVITRIEFAKSEGGAGNVVTFAKNDNLYIKVQNITLADDTGTTFKAKARLCQKGNGQYGDGDGDEPCDQQIAILLQKQADHSYTGVVTNLEVFNAGTVMVKLRVTIPGQSGQDAQKILVHRSLITIVE